MSKAVGCSSLFLFRRANFHSHRKNVSNRDKKAVFAAGNQIVGANNSISGSNNSIAKSNNSIAESNNSIAESNNLISGSTIQSPVP